MGKHHDKILERLEQRKAANKDTTELENAIQNRRDFIAEMRKPNPDPEKLAELDAFKLSLEKILQLIDANPEYGTKFDTLKNQLDNRSKRYESLKIEDPDLAYTYSNITYPNLEAKIKVAETQSKEANAKIHTKVVEKIKLVQVNVANNKQAINTHKEVIDSECKLNDKAIEVYNSSVKNGAK
mgnify:CR=1 FL=1